MGEIDKIVKRYMVESFEYIFEFVFGECDGSRFLFILGRASQTVYVNSA